MARIIGGIASSHSPTIAFAKDTNKYNDPAWAPIFENYKPVQKWVDEKKPDVMFVIYNDHISSFFFEHYSPFALGVDDIYHPADEGGGPRSVPPLKGHAELSRHVAYSLSADEFDLSVFQKKPLDHGCFSPMSMMWEDLTEDWPEGVSMIPLQVGVLQFPIPTARRCYNLGKALRRAIESYPEDLKVAIVATGGLSHQVHGERCGFTNEEWDMQFMDLLVNDPEQLANTTIAEYAERGGVEGAEVIMWMIMRGALSANVTKVHQSYYLPSMTGLATMVLENHSEQPTERQVQDHLDHVTHELKGAENLTGTYPYTLDRSHKAFRINNFLHELVKPEHRDAFMADQDKLFEEFALSDEERQLIRDLDWQGLIHYGTSFFVMEKLGAVVGVSNPHIYAAMRGESFEDFQKTRNVPVNYSVASGDKAKAMAEED